MGKEGAGRGAGRHSAERSERVGAREEEQGGQQGNGDESGKRGKIPGKRSLAITCGVGSADLTIGQESLCSPQTTSGQARRRVSATGCRSAPFAEAYNPL